MMYEKKELDLKFFEHLLQQLTGRRRIFFRDLKVAALLLIAFQFVIFFRFINLSDSAIKLNDQKTKIEADKDAFNRVQDKFELMEKTIDSGSERIISHLDNMPRNLREKFKLLENFIKKLRSGEIKFPTFSKKRSQDQAFQGFKPKSIAPSISVAPNTPTIQQKNPAQTGNLSMGAANAPAQISELEQQKALFPLYLSEAEWRLLKSGDTRKKEFKEAIKSIVNERIIPPMFAELRKIKKESMDEQFVRNKKQLLKSLENHKGILARFNVDTNNIRSQINTIQKELQTLQINEPASDNWWDTFAGKTAISELLAVNIDRSTDKFKGELHGAREKIESVGSELTTLINKTEKKMNEIENKKKDIEAKYKQLQLHLEKYSKPLPWIALKPKEAVLLYPVIFAFVFVFFVWRYLKLQRRAQHLEKMAMKFDVSNELLQFYFDSLFRLSRTIYEKKSTIGSLVTRGFIAILCSAPAVLGLVSIYRIHTSLSMNKEYPLVLYAVSGMVFLVSSLFLILRIFRLPSNTEIGVKL